MLHTSAFVTPELLDEIFAGFKERWTEKYITSVPGRIAAVILVLDPAEPAGVSPQPVKLWQGVLGEPDTSKWPYRYNDFAFAKARAAWRTQMSNHLMFQRNCELIQKGDFKFKGGIYVNGLVTATSGLKSADEDVDVSNEFASAISIEVSKRAYAAQNDKTVLFF